MNVVWLIQNLVPYHHARFEAFASGFLGEAHLVQVTNHDDFGVLEFQAESSTYTLHTLFPGQKRSALSNGDLMGKLDECLVAIKPDCLCISGWGMAIGQLMQLWAVRHQIPTVIFSESTLYDSTRSAWKEWVKQKLVRASSAALVGGHPHAEYIQQLGMPSDRVFLGHNVVDSSHFSSPAPARSSHLPSELEQEPYLLVCTRFGQKKNIPFLVHAFAAYHRKCEENSGKGLRLVIAGDGELRKEIEKTIESESLGSRVHMLGAVDYNSLPWLYQNAEAFVHASTTEQWGLVVNEAMAAKVPVLISSRCGCAPDLVLDGENGFQFDPFSKEGIIATLWKFHNLSTDERNRMGERSAQIVQEWGPSRFGDSLLKAVDCAVKAGSPPKNPPVAMLLRFLLKKGSA